ncbi:MAG: tRNA (adenosine(37)-N6)-threonylcarbamoyltransferase complex ATPase subunit type 1 TsaE [Ginsengibacter sp.]
MMDAEMDFNFDEIDLAAKKFSEATSGYKVFAFSGELGAGKTTFITAICKELKVSETVTSPTYSIIQEYKTNDNKTIFHIDLYRIKSNQEALEAGIEDCLLSNEICMVEWPEKAPDIFPVNTIYSEIEILSSDKRKMIIKLPV